MSVSIREIIDRIRLEMPLEVTLPDPVTGEPFTFKRDNMLALLAIDAENTELESQLIGALYGEVARVSAAAWKAHQEAEIRLRAWKAQKRTECRAKADKKPTDRQTEDYYQADREYGTRYNEAVGLETLSRLFEDLKKAFEIKARAIHDLVGEMYGHSRVQNAEERIVSISSGSLSKLAEETMAASGSADAAANYRESGSLGSPPAPPPEEPDEPGEAKPAAKDDKKKATKKKAGGKKARPIKRPKKGKGNK